ncbi:ABC transporter substrate-binding protein [Amycolatopsis sp. NPDC004079]|uniref:ABC transporter substrate-binding protein n=1 Tax=Amycolatopsis sp. NPDC004079 TaxID=3154549 RepID=UPI0033AA373E
MDDYVGANLLFATLTDRDLDGTTIPGLASGWETRSASDYLLTIRRDATCADGTKITPTAVANSLNYYADKTTTPPHPSASQVFGTGKPTITADDAAGTVTVTLAQPNSDFPAALSIPQAGIICPAGLADKAALAAGSAKGAFSGPYTLGRVKPAVEYTYDLRPDYIAWPRYSAPLAGVPSAKLVFGISTDPSTTANKLLSGDLDLGAVTGDTLDRFAGRGDYHQAKITSANVYIAFNEAPGHYFAGKPEARKAVAQAIDRTVFNKVFSNNASPVFNSVVPKTYACALDDPSLVPVQDPSAAAAALKGAIIRFPASLSFGDKGKGAEYIQKALDDAGATVNLKKIDNATWATTIQQPEADWDMTLMGDVNAASLTSISLSKVIGPGYQSGGINLTASDNPEGLAALAAGRAATDPQQRCAHYQAAQKSVLDRQDVVPLAGVALSLVTAPDVTVATPGHSIRNYFTLRVTK